MAQNEDRFRTINERTTGQIEAFHAPSASMALALVCECSQEECVEMLELALSRYRHVRTDPRWFAVAPRHAAPESVEVVVERHEGHWIVEKVGVGGAVAEELA